ncbi:hypothetical protein GEU84_012520 [Fertoebacter nigrum]|uniref:DUF3298 domain-containing protein n=1 Tax=Fertoeibacter niger TaxID=2656921 RepID=A0A8X8KPT1_9RHOB|nr:hypothetical protein [Fertoeibacter niger]NUB45216.1 hypothetical protein [Fertoeibacter niger]
MAKAMILAAVLVVGSALAAPAQTFTPPEGCTGFMTVQARGCRVSNHYRCEADAPGDQWRADFDAEGIYFVSRIDVETQWVESYDMFPTVKQTLDANPEDPASFTELLAGADSFAFGLSKDNGERSKVTGYDRLTGKTVVIDGIRLLQTEFDFTETSIGGTVLRRAKGNEYIHPDWRLFFAGPSQWDGSGEGNYVPVDGSPVQFIFPGEPGYMATEPLFECDALMSALPPAVVPVGLRQRLHALSGG